MNNDELLSGFLDGSLNQEQLQEFEAKKAADPTFAAEAEDMMTVEGLLTKAESNLHAPAGFLSSVESSVLAKIAIASAGAVGIGYTLNTVWAWIIGASAVVVGGGAVYLTMNTEPKEQTPPQPLHKQVITAPAPTPIIKSPLAEPKPVNSTDAAVIRQNQTPKSTPVTREHTPAVDKNATAEANSPNSTLSALESDYARCIEQQQPIQCAQISLQIGQVYSDRGNTAKAVEYLDAAFKHAKQTRIVQYQVKASGALGLVYANAGNSNDARKYLTMAIDLAKANDMDYQEFAVALRKLQ